MEFHLGYRVRGSRVCLESSVLISWGAWRGGKGGCDFPSLSEKAVNHWLSDPIQVMRQNKMATTMELDFISVFLEFPFPLNLLISLYAFGSAHV